jgi:ankyrin repeat protein
VGNRTPLHWCCDRGWLATAQLLITNGALVNATTKVRQSHHNSSYAISLSLSGFVSSSCIGSWWGTCIPLHGCCSTWPYNTCVWYMQQMVDKEFEKEYVNDWDPSILHFFLVAGENVRSDHPWALLLIDLEIMFWCPTFHLPEFLYELTARSSTTGFRAWVWKDCLRFEVLNTSVFN